MVAVLFVCLRDDIPVMYSDEHIELELFFLQKKTDVSPAPLVSERSKCHLMQFQTEITQICFSKKSISYPAMISG